MLNLFIQLSFFLSDVKSMLKDLEKRPFRNFIGLLKNFDFVCEEVEIIGLFVGQYLRLGFLHGIQRDKQVVISRFALKQLILHFFSLFVIGVILLKNTFFDGLDLGLDIS